MRESRPLLLLLASGSRFGEIGLKKGDDVERFDELKSEAERLGIPINSGVYKPTSEAWNELQVTEWELHRRIKEERRHRREHRLWRLSVAAAVISVLSMIAAWTAVLTHN